MYSIKINERLCCRNNGTKILKMAELKTEHLIFMDDQMYLPISYKFQMVEQPFYEGPGNHSVAQLEAICEQFKEYVHQQQVIKQNCMKHIVELKFDVKLKDDKQLRTY